ncbi:hypothetical protein BDW62DRAFT_173767 [Aspergillus aurantiobrunneus]
MEFACFLYIHTYTLYGVCGVFIYWDQLREYKSYEQLDIHQNNAVEDNAPFPQLFPRLLGIKDLPRILKIVPSCCTVMKSTNG